ncbi:hypothetical protein DOTSEDRAFT_54669 [Lecanosticta acicola]|uniref:Carbohydrate kinase PfkB domain-containing protein n=1 Tax=Lecanosticta acicola TaxID=111012 RepID=A0AAI8YZS6_9PEZI|nr:hypothetical protein DOTSEDRAFT_54669 [Lecanosticta acicola]
MSLPWICRACRSHAIASRRYSDRLRTVRSISSNSKFFRVSEEVQQAISERRPVVALESTIYTHGFPYPDNLALASRLESLVRLNGGVPATIGILEGVARVGLGADELVRLVSSAGSPNLLKISRRDLGFVLGLRGADGNPLNGGTTISGTSVLAHMAGIKVFATGGLGGVHRGAEQTMDISADLTELGKTPITVISSGCKSFLDIPKTLEYLETQGVAVATFADGRTGDVDFPAFYTRESGVKSPKVLQHEKDAARVIYAQSVLGLQSGLHFANPIPEEHSLPFEDMERAIEQAIREASTAGATGAASTPYILAKIKELTGSKSVAANRALVEANVIRGTKVAVAVQKLEMEGQTGSYYQSDSNAVVVGPAASNYTSDGVPKGFSTATGASKTASSSARKDSGADAITTSADVFVAGSLAVDLACDYEPRSGTALSSPELHTSNPAQIAQSLGGVGSNVARAAHLMGASVRLCSAVGADLTGKAALEALTAAQMSISGIKVMSEDSESRTSQYVAFNDKNKDLVLAMADMSILEQASISSAFTDFWLPQLTQFRPSHLVVDGNWPPDLLARWLEAGKAIDAHVSFEPVSNVKSTGLFSLPRDHRLGVFPNPSIHLATPNSHELAAMYTAAREKDFFDRKDWWECINSFGIPDTGARVQLCLSTSSELVDQGIPQQSLQLLPFIPSICTKLGSQGVLLTQIIPAGDERLTNGDYAPYILSRNMSAETADRIGGVYMRLFPRVEEIPSEAIVSVNGVGDTFIGTLIAGLSKRGKAARVEDLVDLAQRAAVLSLKSKGSVSPGLGTLRLLL